jgi:hypothetical protein
VKKYFFSYPNVVLNFQIYLFPLDNKPPEQKIKRPERMPQPET